MKKSYIAIIILVLLVLVIFVFTSKSKKLEAPTLNEVPIVNNQEQIEVKEFFVTGQNFSFSPNVITVKRGDLVKITFNNTEGFHDFKIDEFGVATKQAQSPDTEVLEFIADKTGSFEYYCSVGTHRDMGMKGVLNIEE